MFDICPDAHKKLIMSVRLLIVGTTELYVILFWGDLTKPAITLTIASVERFHLNLVICLQLDIALLIQNSVKI